MAIQKFSTWLEANENDPRVIALVKLANGPFRINGASGRCFGKLMRETEAERSQVAA